MKLGRPVIGLELNEAEQKELTDLVRSQSIPSGIMTRAKIVLLCGAGENRSTLRLGCHC